MAVLVAQFFQICGIGAAPTNLAELIPYLLTVFVGVFLVSAVFGLIGKLAEMLIDFTRWR